MLAVASAWAQQTETASVEGMIVNAKNGEPLPRVHVRLTSEGEPALVYGALTTPQGHFSISKIKPGEYSITLSRPGFLKTSGPDADDDDLHVTKGDEIKLQLAMMPATILSGHVLDEYGDPMMYVDVTAEPVGP